MPNPKILAIATVIDNKFDGANKGHFDSAAEQATTRTDQPDQIIKPSGLIVSESFVSSSGGGLGGHVDDVEEASGPSSPLAESTHGGSPDRPSTPSSGGCDAGLQVGAEADPGVTRLIRQIGVANMTVYLAFPWISKPHDGDACETESWESFSVTEPDEPENDVQGQSGDQSRNNADPGDGVDGVPGKADTVQSPTSEDAMAVFSGVPRIQTAAVMAYPD
ncbi:hypothetical protein N658DRAFT_483632 [Parathielavia hyrcaniae]|uniref:Uncharacterized protein n=1 Tax=Parathielavia hyrcaniae TaxID=113614 RepID=A0AAN6QC58_9PEZI|nr:hypothetical protein N658DRAFT_483632 [Parathielavia hyrcaniae]